MQKTSEKGLSETELDELIGRLTGAQEEAQTLCHMARSVFLEQTIWLELEAPLKVVGDIHAQFQDLLKIFECSGYPPQQDYLFLGDYVDRGRQPVQTMALLLAYKVRYPQNFFLLRGNHESAEINKLYGFYDQCKRKFSLRLWKTFTDTFNAMPFAALIEEKIFYMHGGISPELTKLNKIMNINRPTQIPASGMLCDLLWANPVQNTRGWHQNTERGISYLFGSDVLSQFLKINNLDLPHLSVASGKQLFIKIVQQGYQFFGKRKLLTIFSAPNYCGQFQNWGAVLNVDQDLICSFQVINPQLKKGRQGQQAKNRPKTPKYVN